MVKKKLSTKISKPKVNLIKPELPGGFRDYGPADAIIKQRLLEKLRKTFEDFGFEPMETPAVEWIETLIGGETESDKLIFRLNPAKKGGEETKDIKKDKIALRFDLTVPLARFVAANPDIPKPFKRYQIGNVWRGERQQAGRYREFTQADIDIVGSSAVEADAEVVSVVYQLLKNLGLSKFVIKINNRKLLNGLPELVGFPEKKLIEVLRLIDKKDKIGQETMKRDLQKKLGRSQTEKITEFLEIPGDTKNKLITVRDWCKEVRIATEGVEELIEVARNLNASGIDQKNWGIDFSIARGLGYYTGSVFETLLLDATDLGSIASGGRYDNLMIPFTGQKISAVGVSFGVDRLFTALDKIGLIKKKATTVRVLILNLASELKSDYLSLAKDLRQANINTAIYLGDDRSFQAQLAYAVKKEIPYVFILGEEEKKKGVVNVKNLVTREQKEVPRQSVLQYFKK